MELLKRPLLPHGPLTLIRQHPFAASKSKHALGKDARSRSQDQPTMFQATLVFGWRAAMDLREKRAELLFPQHPSQHLSVRKPLFQAWGKEGRGEGKFELASMHRHTPARRAGHMSAQPTSSERTTTICNFSRRLEPTTARSGRSREGKVAIRKGRHFGVEDREWTSGMVYSGFRC